MHSICASPKRGPPLVNLRHSPRVSGRENEGEQNYPTDSDDAKPRSRQSTLIEAAGRKEENGRR
jgi:hypothetical protein